MLIANTDIEAKQLIDLYDAEPGRVEVVHPGVDLDVFRPLRPRPTPGRASACRRTRTCCCSPAGSSRSRPPTCCCAPSRRCSSATPALRSRLVVPGRRRPVRHRPRAPRVAGPAGRPTLGLADVVRFVPPVAQAELAEWYAAADPGRRTVLQRVLRPGRRRGAGRRHAGRRRRGRRADHRRARRRAAACWSTATSRATGPPALRRRHRRRRPARPARRAGALRAGGASSRGSAPPSAPSRSTSGRGRSCARPSRDRPMSDARRRDPRLPRPTTSSSSTRPPTGVFIVRAARARRSCRPPSGSTSATHALGVHAFVCRKPDENHERVYRWLLERNLKMYAVSFAVDRLGDIYLDARLPLAVGRRPTSSTGCSARC